MLVNTISDKIILCTFKVYYAFECICTRIFILGIVTYTTKNMKEKKMHNIKINYIYTSTSKYEITFLEKKIETKTNQDNTSTLLIKECKKCSLVLFSHLFIFIHPCA